MKRKYRIGSVSLSHEIVASPSRICSSVSLVATPRPPQGADRFMLTTILAYVIAPRNDAGKEIWRGSYGGRAADQSAYATIWTLRTSRISRRRRSGNDQ